jgi:hypothetical protein
MTLQKCALSVVIPCYNEQEVLWETHRRLTRMLDAMPATEYPLAKMLRFAVDGVVSFSVVPLRAATLIGFAVSALAGLGIVYAFAMRLFTDVWVTGWTTLVIAVLMLGGVQLLALGIIGEYVGRIYGESKRRPLYLLQDRDGFDQPAFRRPVDTEVAIPAVPESRPSTLPVAPVAAPPHWHIAELARTPEMPG